MWRRRRQTQWNLSVGDKLALSGTLVSVMGIFVTVYPQESRCLLNHLSLWTALLLIGGGIYPILLGSRCLKHKKKPKSKVFFTFFLQLFLRPLKPPVPQPEPSKFTMFIEFMCNIIQFMCSILMHPLLYIMLGLGAVLAGIGSGIQTLVVCFSAVHS